MDTTAPGAHGDSGPASVPTPSAVAASAVAFARAWRALFDAELAFALGSLRALAVAAALLPLLLFAAWCSAIAALACGLHALGLGWAAAGSLCLALQIALIVLLLAAMRRWARGVSLRRSRAALERLRAP